MAELHYVDWDGLVYYDGKSKDYINKKISECLKFKGDISFEGLVAHSPSYYNVNTAFRLKEKFVSNDWFKNPGYRYPANTIVYVTQVENGSILYDVLFDPGVEVDLSNYYTNKQINDIVETLETKQDAAEKLHDAKQYTDAQISAIMGGDVEEAYNSFKELQELIKSGDSAIETIVSDVNTLKNNYVDKEELNNSLADVAKQGDVNSRFDSVNGKITTIEESLAAIEPSENLVTKAELEAKNYASVEYVQEAVDNIQIPEGNFATKGELSAVESKIPNIDDFISNIPSNYITEEELQKEGFLKSQSLDNYYTKEEVYTKKEIANLIPDEAEFATKQYVEQQISKIEIPTVDVSTLATKDELSAVVSKIPDSADFATKEDLNTSLLEISNKADKILFTEDYRVTNPLGGFLENDSVQNKTISEILTTLLGLTLYSPSIELPEGTPETVKNLVNNSSVVYVLDELEGTKKQLDYEYKVMSQSEAKQDDQVGTYVYQVVEDNTLLESGYHITTIYQENDFLTIFLPNFIKNFYIKEFSPSANDWSEPLWKLQLNDSPEIVELTPDGYLAYTVDPSFEVSSGIALRIVIED